MFTIDTLNNLYGVNGQLRFFEGSGGLPFIAVNHQHASALISIYAAQVLSYQPADEKQDLLFVSSKANYSTGKTIRGGIPVCWPWFGPDPDQRQRPNHGFARLQLWEVCAAEAAVDETKIVLQLSANEQIAAIWDYPFTVTLEITVGKTLGLTLTTENTGKKVFAITEALHSYFLVGDIGNVQINGLEETHYRDKLAADKQKYQQGAVIIGEEVDRIYTGVKDRVIIDDLALKRQIEIFSPKSDHIVVWNPWVNTIQSMADLADQDYQRFVCVETGHMAGEPITIAPDEAHELLTEIKILPGS